MHTIHLIKAKPDEFDTFWNIQQGIAGDEFYSMMDREEAQEEFDACEFYFIKKGDDIVGVIWYEVKSPEHVYISGTIIKLEYQKQGFGKEAKRLLLERLKDVRRIDAVVHPDNAAMIAINQSLGFSIESRVENYYGDGEPRLVMVKLNK